MKNQDKAKRNAEIREPIAIVGIGCRFPGDANDPESYWNLLVNGVDAISEVPADRWNLQSFFSEDKSVPGKTYTTRSGFIKDIDMFDPEFFGISPREAACMDPQQRILLESVSEAFADAGINPADIAGTNVGVYMGIFTHDYNNLLLDSSNRELIDTHTGVGVSMSIVANRISYVFDLIGASVTMDTACSSSMVALHLACQSIYQGESRIAIAGGANAILKPEFTIATSKASMLSPDGHCKSFDASANGYVRSEGGGVLVLKPLSDAQRDGDLIYALINGSVVNQDGKSDGITVPNASSQKLAIRQVLEKTGVDPADVFYAEAHGTGTLVGDPIEANSIGSVLSQNRSSELLIGSVKANIGHMEAGSGVASVVKVALALKNRQVPPNILFNTPNPEIEFEKYHMRVPTSVEPWVANSDGGRCACINSFGFGGTNASVIMSEAPSTGVKETKKGADPLPVVLTLSGHTPKALEAVVARMLKVLEENIFSLEDIIYSATLRSGHQTHRLALVAEGREGLIDLATQFLDGKESPSVVKGSSAYAGGKLAFVFAGMGTQWWAMGRQLFEENAFFRRIIEECDKKLGTLADWSIIEELTRDEETSMINKTEFAQPAIFVIEIALARLWQSWGVEPDLICGHSLGEVSAAHISGALSLDDAIKVIYHRSRLQQKTNGMGGMLAASLTHEAGTQFIEDVKEKVSVAAVNSPTSLTFAGDTAVLENLEKQLTEKKIFCRMLKVEVPYHSVVMEVIKDELLESLQDISPKETEIPLYSSVTGKLISGSTLDANYWWNNVREPVKFHATIQEMSSLPQGSAEVFLEISPHPVLTQSMNETLSSSQSLVLGSIKRKQDEMESLSGAIGSLYTYGFPLHWEMLTKGSFVRLPKYPWQRTSYWRESELSAEDRTGNMSVRSQLLKNSHPLLGGRMELAIKDSIWEGQVHHGNIGFLKGHQVYDSIVFPGAAFIEMAVAAAGEKNPSAVVVENLSFLKALVLEEEPARTQFLLSDGKFTVFTERKNGENPSLWVKHVVGDIAKHSAATKGQGIDVEELRLRCGKEVGSEDLYQGFSAMGFNYTGDFCKISSFQHNGSESISRIDISPNTDGYGIYPPLLDNGFQALLAMASKVMGDESADRVFLPVQLERVVAHRHLPDSSASQGFTWCHANIVEFNSDGLKGDISLYDHEGKILVSIEGLQCLAVTQERWKALMQQEKEKRDSSWFNEVQWVPLEPKVGDIEAQEEKQRWMIFGDKGGRGSLLAKELQKKGDAVSYVENPSENLDALLAASKEEETLSGILYLWTLDNVALDKTDDSSCGCDSLLLLIQALNRNSVEVPLTLITKGGQVISSGDFNAEQSPLWGFAQVISLEQPQLQCKCVDLDPATGAAEDATSLLHWMKVGDAEDRVGFRNGTTFGARLISSSFQLKDDEGETLASLGEKAPAASLFRDGTYLVTGGFGALGRLIAKRLVERGARNIVLMGRSGAKGHESFVEELTASGAKVKSAAADVTSLADVQRVFQEVSGEMPAVRGVVHAAGILDDGIIANQEVKRFEAIMKPKVRGAWNLHQATEGIELDFFLCFSSVASLTGSPGQANYAAGNAFMDALSHYRKSLGMAAMSINWGPWAEEGMAAAQLERLESKGFEAIDIGRGLDVFQQLATENDIAQIGVAPIDWEKFFSSFPQNNTPFYSAFYDKLSTDASGGESFMEQLQSVDEAEREEFLLKHIDEVVGAVLGLKVNDSSDRQKLLKDSGLDSLMSLEIINRLESSLGLSLVPTLLFEYPSIESLGGFLSDELSLKPSSEAAEDELDEELLNELDSLDDDELQKLLEDELG